MGGAEVRIEPVDVALAARRRSRWVETMSEPGPTSARPATAIGLPPSLARRIAEARVLFARASTGDLEGLTREARNRIAAIALEAALLLFDADRDRALRATLTRKWFHLQPWFNEHLADGVRAGLDPASTLRVCLRVLVHTQGSPEDAELRQAVRVLLAGPHPRAALSSTQASG